MHKRQRGLALIFGATLAVSLSAHAGSYFDQIASFLVCENTSCEDETSSEIIVASPDGNTLIYSDSPGKSVGLIDITDPTAPAGLGAIDLSDVGEPTSVAVLSGVDGGDAPTVYILVAINTSPDFGPEFEADHSGVLHAYKLAECVADATSCAPVAPTFSLGGQPDSIAVSPDQAYVAIAIENERDEEACHDEFGNLQNGDAEDGYPNYGEDNEDNCTDAGFLFGRLPQPGAGWLAVIDNTSTDAPTDWDIDTVELTLTNALYPSDPEPEYVSINGNNEAVVTLQENNAVVIVDLTATPRVVTGDYSAGSVDLVDIDTKENDLIELNAELPGTLREPDGVTWIGDTYYATANEGDMDGGSRGFSIFDASGTELFESGEAYDHLQVMHGHYPESRSENKGSEPEAVTYSMIDGNPLLLVASERGNTVAVYNVAEVTNPVLVQFLPAVMGPESVVAIPGQDLIAIANEVDDEARSMVNLYKWTEELEAPVYPTVVSDLEGNPGLPIPWGALSGLTAGDGAGELHAVHDSFYVEPRIFDIDATTHPARITGYTKLFTTLPGRSQDDLDEYDLEGIARRAEGGFWLVSEGTGNAEDFDDREFEDENLLIRVAADGEVLEEIRLPEDIAAKQHRFGFEGVAVTGSGSQERVYVAFQREWLFDEPEGIVRIGEYRPQTGNWKFHWYPLDPREANSGWVGLSEIVAIGPRQFLVLERDNQAGPFAKIKRIYKIDLDEGRDANLQGNKGKGKGKSYPTVRKTLVYDLLPLYESINGWVPDKPEGMTVDSDGDVWVITDNDGVDDAPGQTWLFNIGQLD